ncbi:MFS Git1p-related glycerophosphoinositol and glycerophosphocholine permease [Guyanagaster necrorhizus]|uniref:MFS Git1p-related glycerophosphoinositol and glycerophosphocholine permease n=1 Tax=Guyanagaster necrorhizus TaxID=856835 RepID=A0A9P8AWZ9_9AGAR|nr:MFS Git1p-related glycerophosphoinositol and glycerophosphocholine permease [Guyanagaster necrorhizus MCA 3950]KAG7451098.1 MFS Git1p-related glycerophosphoinositol and glycerophosphocholine permease [Guyanagaster necrorhizus MCA 3950]
MPPLKSVSLIFACGTALFSDGYANNIIGSVNTLLKRIYGTEVINAKNYSTLVSSLAFAGTVVGMLVFGYLSDKIGRKFGMMAATGIVALFSGLSAASSGAHHSVDGMLSMLCACRFLLGIGVGAEYPCGSVAASENSEEDTISKNAQHRWFTLATNSMIDFGFVISAFVVLVLYWIFGENHLRAVWRLSLGLGVVPALAVFIWRLRMDEPQRYKKDSMKRVRIPYMLVLRRYGVSLAAISFTWFLYDFIVYPFGLYSSTVVNNITGGSEKLSIVFGWNVVINLFYIPGTILGAFVVDFLGPKWTMIVGLLSQAIIGFIMSGCYEKLASHVAAFAVVYGIFLSFGELGPGNNIGLLASKTSPTAIRGQFYGIAAATGKVGAFVGIWAFPPMIDAFGGKDTTRGNTGPFWVGSGLAILSAIVTFCFIKPLSHDGMVEEDIAFRQYLESRGYDTSQMGLGVGSDISSETAEEDEKKIPV